MVMTLTALTFVAFAFQSTRDFRGAFPYITPFVWGVIVFGAGRYEFTTTHSRSCLQFADSFPCVIRAIWPNVSVADSAIAVSAAILLLLIQSYDTFALFHRLIKEQTIDGGKRLAVQPSARIN